MSGVICFVCCVWFEIVLFCINKTNRDFEHLEQLDCSLKFMKEQRFTDFFISKARLVTIQECSAWINIYEDLSKINPEYADKWMEDYVGLNWMINV